MANQCANSVVVKSNDLHSAVLNYKLMAERFLTSEEKECLSKLKETEFMELVNEKGWKAYKIS